MTQRHWPMPSNDLRIRLTCATATGQRRDGWQSKNSQPRRLVIRLFDCTAIWSTDSRSNNLTMISISEWPDIAKFCLIAFVAALLSAVIIICSWRLLARVALAHPNSRSSHSKPTPQGGGIGVIAATIIVASGAGLLLPEMLGDSRQFYILIASAIGLAVLGF